MAHSANSATIKAGHNLPKYQPGSFVWWVHPSNKVIHGNIVQEVLLNPDDTIQYILQGYVTSFREENLYRNTADALMALKKDNTV